MRSKKIFCFSFLSFITFCILSFAQTPSVYFQQGNTAFEKKLFDSAVMLYTKAIESDPGSSEIYIKRGRAFLETGKNDDAIVDFSTAISLDPKSGEAYYYRGVARKLKKSPAQNWCDDFRKAIALGFQNATNAIKEDCK